MGAIENFRADPLDDPESRLVLTAQDYQPPKRGALDTEAVVAKHRWLLTMVGYEKRRQGPNRRQMALDADYYDSEQFTDTDLQELIDRGQAPLVYNLVKRTADWVIGTEKRTRFDFKVLGRTRDDVESARAKTDAMKYLQDVNRTVFHRSQAFRESVISGLGWLEDGVRGDADEESIYCTNESWWYSLGDSHAMKLDNTDARYHFRWRWMDLDVALAWFPEREHLIRANVENGGVVDEKLMDDYYLGNRLAGEDYLAGQFQRGLSWAGENFVDASRDRVRVYEGWFKSPVREKTLLSKGLPQFHGERYDAGNEDMRHALMIGDASITERVNMRVFYCIFTDTGVLAAGRSPYRHNEFPFTPVWCYRRGRDNAPYGIIRGIRDPQDGFNRRMAKSIFAYTAYRVIATANAIDPKTMSWEDVRTEAGRPDALLVKKSANETLEVQRDKELGDAQFKIAQSEASLILDASGVTADNLGMESNAQSGKAILAKQAEGSAVTAEIFDNYRLACQISGEKELSLIEQFWSEEKTLRVTDAKGRPNYRKVNEIKVDPKTGEPKVENDMTATKADFVIDPQDFHATMRQAATEALGNVLKQIGNLDPKIVLRVLRMMADASDWPNKEEMVKELDQMTGHKDPEAALTEEEQAEQKRHEEEQAAAQQQQQQMQQAAFQAELDEKVATAEKLRADAERALADAKKIKAEAENIAKGDGGAAIQQAVAEAEAQAQEALKAAQQQILDLEAQGRDSAAKWEAERYKAEQDREARVAVADRQFPKPEAVSSELQEQLADVAQDVAALTKLVGELAKKAEKSASEPSGKAQGGVVIDMGKAVGDSMAGIGESIQQAVAGLAKAQESIAAMAEKSAAAADAVAQAGEKAARASDEATQAVSKVRQASDAASAKKNAGDSEDREYEFDIGGKKGVIRRKGRKPKRKE